MLADMSRNDVAVLRTGVRENVLDEIVAVLVTRNVDQGDAGTVDTALADSIQIAAEELGAPNLEALLDNLGSELVHRVLGGVSNDMIDGSATVCRGTVLADVLDAPVAELTMSHNVDVGKYLLDARTLTACVNLKKVREAEDDMYSPCPPPGSSQRCSERPSCQSLPRQPRATCRVGPH